MTVSNEELELKDRLSLIETMIAEGRRSTESYGWTFVLWGVAYYAAIAWSNLFHYYLAWPVTMLSTCVLMALIVWRKSRNRGYRPGSTTKRAIWATWAAMGISAFVILDSLGFSYRMDQHAYPHVFMAVMATLLATANAASSIILKWKLQFACAMVWWITVLVCCFGTARQSSIAFLAAMFLCQVAFGVYLMIREARARRQAARHA
jgi:hypothetical protein